MGFLALERSFTKGGNRPHWKAAIWRAPVTGSSRTTGASFVGAMFHVASMFGSGPLTSKKRARTSTGRKLAYRPHMQCNMGVSIRAIHCPCRGTTTVVARQSLAADVQRQLG